MPSRLILGTIPSFPLSPARSTPMRRRIACSRCRGKRARERHRERERESSVCDASERVRKPRLASTLGALKAIEGLWPSSLLTSPPLPENAQLWSQENGAPTAGTPSPQREGLARNDES